MLLKCVVAVFLFSASLKLAFGAFPTTQVTTIEGVPENWYQNTDTSPFVKIGAKYYYIETRKKANWFDAAHICRTMNANLATIENEVEFDGVTKHIRKQGYDITNYYWMAINDLGQNGKYYSLGTGKPMIYAKWSPGNPDRFGENEHCVLIWNQSGIFSMNDFDCKALTHYICQANTPQTISFTIW